MASGWHALTAFGKMMARTSVLACGMARPTAASCFAHSAPKTKANSERFAHDPGEAACTGPQPGLGAALTNAHLDLELDIGRFKGNPLRYRGQHFLEDICLELRLVDWIVNSD
ncbi:MAG: hypothetical protein NVSMB6_13960 [Burkholderiaceae bacterium]